MNCMDTQGVSEHVCRLITFDWNFFTTMMLYISYFTRDHITGNTVLSLYSFIIKQSSKLLLLQYTSSNKTTVVIRDS